MNMLDFLFPKQCLRCGNTGTYLCTGCIVRVPYAKAICPMCAKPSIDGFVHNKCRKPYGLDGVINLWEYRGIVRSTIIALKFKYVSDVSSELAKRFVEQVTLADKPMPRDGLIIPIPLHISRERWRGFNQSDELGKRIAHLLGFEYRVDLLKRTENTLPQTKVQDKEHRMKNIQGAFVFNHQNKDFLMKCEKTIFVFDDVWTTGTTLREAGKVLKRNGAKVVWGMTIAH